MIGSRYLGVVGILGVLGLMSVVGCAPNYSGITYPRPDLRVLSPSLANLTSAPLPPIPENLRVDGQGVHARVLDAVAACSVLVVTSKTEGMPTLVLEGMALRRPVVVPYVHGCAEAVGDERHGFIYRHDDLDDLVEKTLAALADRQRGQRARERVLAEYDWRVVAPKLDAIYRGEAAAVDGGIA